MKPIPFLTEEEIQKLQEVEANSSPNENATNTNPTPEQNTTPNGTTP